MRFMPCAPAATILALALIGAEPVPSAAAAAAQAAKKPAAVPKKPPTAAERARAAARRATAAAGAAAAAAATTLALADDDQKHAFTLTHLGEYECEFKRAVRVLAHPKHEGYVDLHFDKRTITARPVLSSTGAIRLEDVTGRYLMVQIAFKSMLMDTRLGQRVADECLHDAHHEAKRAAAGAPPAPGLGISTAAPAATLPVAAPAPAPEPAHAQPSAPRQPAPGTPSAPVDAPAPNPTR